MLTVRKGKVQSSNADSRNEMEVQIPNARSDQRKPESQA
jgi:hypothetical protein